MLGGGPLGAFAVGQAPEAQESAIAATGGIGPLGRWALGELPDAAVDAVAAGAALSVGLALVPGAAIGEQPPVSAHGWAIVTRRRRLDAIVPGAQLDLSLLLRPGRAVSGRLVNASAPGAVLPLLAVRIAEGTASGDATGYDNDLLWLLAA